MTLAEMRTVMLRELALRALSAGDLSDFARGALLLRIGSPLVRRHVTRGHRIWWRDNLNLYADGPLVVERVTADQIMFDKPRLVVAMPDFCKAIANGKATDP